MFKLTIPFLALFISCSETSSTVQDPVSSVLSSNHSFIPPVGFSIIEQQPDGFFIRLASAERATPSTIRELADTFAGKFARVDLCLDGAHERGDEYASIIGSQVFDHENDNIYSLNSISE